MGDRTFGLSFRKFAQAVRTQQRFVRDSVIEEFLDGIRESAQARAASIPAGGICWRAQVGHEEIDDEMGYRYRIEGLPPSRMMPLPDRATEGRINAKGIPCLYLANNRMTAIAEVRPWRHALVSVAAFQIARDLRVVDCSKDDPDARAKLKTGYDAPPFTEAEIWGEINQAFSEPIQPNDGSADYVPTQILAELFRHNRYDGVAFLSSVGHGHNIALFDLRLARLISCQPYRVDAIEYKASERGNPYFKV